MLTAYRALCSNSPEGGGASLGDAKTYPQFSWLLEHQEDKLYFRSGAKIRFSALDNGCGDRGRFMCSNCDGIGYSYTGDAETGNTYGWEIVSADGSKHIRYGEPVHLMKIDSDTCMRSDVAEAGNFSFSEPSDDPGTHWYIGKSDGHWQEESDCEVEGRRIESGETVQLAKQDLERVLCSNMSEGGFASFGSINTYPQFGWRIVSGTGKKYIKAGDPVILAALDTSQGELNRVFCSNVPESGGCSWSNPPWGDHIYEYGFTMNAFSGSRYIRFGDVITLTHTNGTHLCNSVGEGEGFQFTDEFEADTCGWVIANYDEIEENDDWGGYSSEDSDW